MRIYDDLQLDYCDVLLRPKRSALTSRSEVDIIREYTFKWCPKTIKATGIVAANMATTGSEMVFMPGKDYYNLLNGLLDRRLSIWGVKK